MLGIAILPIVIKIEKEDYKHVNSIFG